MENGLLSVTEDQSHLGKTAERGNPSFVWRAGQERRLAMVREWAPLEGQRVLDVGAGVGMYTAVLGRYAAQVAGIEVELDRAREAFQGGMPIAQALGEALPFAEGAFDVVFSHEVIEHVKDDGRVVAEMVRVVVPGGRLVVFCPNRWYPFETHGHYWRGRYHFGNTPLINYLPDLMRDRLAPHVRAYSARRLRALFRHLPVRILHHRQIYPGYDNVVARRPALGRWLRRLTYLLERTPLRILGISHFLVLEKLD
jgi:SAM-dependent methyltransferase